jgi:ankyrin repeat protein
VNTLQQAAFELRLDDLKATPCSNGGDFDGTLLAACSAHDPDPAIQVRVIQYLLECGVSVGESDKNGVTALHRAVRFRSLAATRELITHGANVNVVDKKTKSTPLHRAVMNTGAPATSGKTQLVIEITKLLLSHGADPRIKNKNGKTPLDYVKNEEMKDVFRKHGVT